MQIYRETCNGCLKEMDWCKSTWTHFTADEIFVFNKDLRILTELGSYLSQNLYHKHENILLNKTS